MADHFSGLGGLSGLHNIDIPQFAPAGGVTAQSINADQPQCGPKMQAVLDADGKWQCVPAPESDMGGLLLLLAAGLGWWLWTKYGHKITGKGKRGGGKRTTRAAEDEYEDLEGDY